MFGSVRGLKPVRFATPEKEKRRQGMDLFPQYSSSHPEFEDETINMHSMKPIKPHEMSDGTPCTVAMSPGMNTSFSDLVKSPSSDSNKQFPLHVQTDETEDEEEPYIPERPEDFTPMRSPSGSSLYPSKVGSRRPPQNNNSGAATNNSLPMFEMPRVRDLKLPASWKKWRFCFLAFLFLGLLIGIIVLPMWASGKFSSSKSDPTPNSASSESTGIFMGSNAGGAGSTYVPSNNMFKPGKAADKGRIPNLPGFVTESPSVTPLLMMTTAAPSIASVPTVAPSSLAPVITTDAPTAYPTTPAPTLDGTHRFIPILSKMIAEDILLDPYSFAGEALIWMVTKDMQLDNVNSDRRIVQRFAVTLLDVALHAPKARVWSSRNSHECRWQGVTCDEQRWVTGINWARQGLVGTIPSELGLLSKLTSVDLAENQLKGTLDPLYDLLSLEYAYVFDNELTGTLNKEGLENLGNLTRLFAGHNQLSGSIPAVKIRPLEWLILHYNRLTGTVPSDLSLGLNVILDLSYNRLSGTLPENFGTDIVPNIRHLHLDHNRFTGSIPRGFRELGKGRLRQLYLNDNQFSGAFPDEWKTVKHLNNIDLSNNNFQNNLNDMCLMSVFEYGELVELRADCKICNCDRLCRTCSDNIDHEYVYYDDWEFDDDWIEGADDDDDDDV